ncbi:MAG: amino acid ABC transporter substrate-binding protein [Anaerolineales bacterium]|nr:amino acid ABC transporter substrate-binding protein [Anaerolineales bacterium]MCB8951297.1 amino acid ABC transporter substrate-binding protein [Ardenticatenales bacterium]
MLFERFARGRAGILPLLALISGIFMMALLVGCRHSPATWTRIQEQGVLRIGLDPTYPPFETADANSVWGYDVDLMRAIADHYGLQAQFTYFGYDGLYDALSTAQVDVLASALVTQPERTRDFAYSQPYFDAGQVLIVPTASPITGVDDLNNRVLAVELGAQGHVLATTWERRLPGMTIVPYNSVDEALAVVTAGTADAALVDSIGGRLYLRQAAGLMRLSPPAESEPYALVVRADDEVLLQKLNEALATLESRGVLAELERRWLDTPDN